MLIVCPKCSASYEVKAEAIGDKGRTVRCVHCRTEWFVTAPLLEDTEVIGATEVETAVDQALPPPMVAAVADHPPPTQAQSEDEINWDIPAPDSDQSAPAAGDENLSEESIE